jgi:isochorismate hydrolase
MPKSASVLQLTNGLTSIKNWLMIEPGSSTNTYMCYNFFMKEQYFSHESIQTLASEWLQIFANSKQVLAQPFRIQKAALLLLDLQQYFLDPDSHAYIPSGTIILNELNQLASAFRSHNRPVIATQHINTTKDAGRMGDWWSELITKDHALVDIHPDVLYEPGEILIKTQYDAFYNTDLSARLAERDVTQLVIGGVMTHLCCETTARSAFIRGYEVFFLVDGTATYHQDYHLAALRNLSHGFAVLTTTERLLEGASI